MPEKPSPRAVALGARLRELRAARFRFGTNMARDTGWPQSKVSKIERGAQLPTQSDLELWLSATGASGEVRAEVQDLLAAARVRYRQYRDAWATPGGVAEAQREIAELDMRSTRIVEYQPAMMPGLVQTPAYARDVLSAVAGPSLVGARADQIEEKVTAQVRRQEVLYVPGKRIQIAVGEAALHTRFGSAEVLAGQRDRLVTVAGLATVEVAVLPFTTPSPILPLAGFAFNDDAVAWVETLSGEQRLDDPAEVAVYVEAFDAVWAASAVGDEAVEFIRNVAG